MNVTGYTDDEIATVDPTGFFAEDHKERISRAIEEVIETGSATVQAHYLTGDGGRIPREFTGSRLADPEGKILGVVGIGRNLTRERVS